MTVFSLHLTFGLLIMPELAQFSHSAYRHAEVADVGMQQIVEPIGQAF